MRSEVQDYIRARPKCERLVRALGSVFEVTFATDERLHNAEFNVFFLKPERSVADAFGLNYEILAVYSPFPKAQPRLAQVVEKVINDSPAKGRVDRIVVMVLSDDPDVEQWATRYSMDHPDSRLMLAGCAPALVRAQNPRRFVTELLQKRLYHVDLFDYRLPLNSDTFYFGRRHELTRITNSVERGENTGIFGLRKTGKTSFLFKVRRVLHDSGRAHVVYYDCKLPEIRTLTWHELIRRIAFDVSQRLGTKWREPASIHECAASLRELVRRSKVPIVLAFDEIEFISPAAVLDSHWGRDFVDFWQTIWGIQSQDRKLVAIISGVIPKMVETERYSGVQNPLFSIVKCTFLRGFPEEDVEKMVTAIGGKVGLRFGGEAISYLVERYGGHPYLTRLTCSSVLERIEARGEGRPFEVTEELLRSGQEQRERHLLPYVRHVVAELREFYPTEYEVLELLSVGKVLEYHELAIEPEFVEHLRSYGIVSERGGLDEVSIPIVRAFIDSECQRRNGQVSVELVPTEQRAEWYKTRIRSILEGVRQLADHFRSAKRSPFLPVGGVPEADRLLQAPIALDEHSCAGFFVAANRSLVESIEVFLKEKGHDKPWAEPLPVWLPRLSRALQRIKIYRHECGHIQLTDPKVIALRDEFLREDLRGRTRGALPDYNFLLQQSAVESLHSAVQMELLANRLV